MTGRPEGRLGSRQVPEDAVRDAAQSLAFDELDALMEALDPSRREVEIEAGPAPGANPDWNEHPELAGDNGVDFFTDQDGDFTETDDGADSPEETGDDISAQPARTRRPRSDVRITPGTNPSGGVQFRVSCDSGTRALDSHGGARSDEFHEHVRRRQSMAVAIVQVVVEQQREFLLELCRTDGDLGAAMLKLKPVTQQYIQEQTGLDKDTVSRLANSARLRIECPGQPALPLSELIPRGSRLGVPPAALRAWLERLAPDVRSNHQLVDRLIHLGVVQKPADARARKSLRTWVGELRRMPPPVVLGGAAGQRPDRAAWTRRRPK
jgi:hypothetical protein